MRSRLLEYWLSCPIFSSRLIWREQRVDLLLDGRIHRALRTRAPPGTSEAAASRRAVIQLPERVEPMASASLKRALCHNPALLSMGPSPYVTLVLGVLLVSVGAILVRLAAAPPLAVSFYRMAIATLILWPFAWGDARRSWPALGEAPTAAARRRRRGAGPPFRDLDREPLAHVRRRFGPAREHGTALRDRDVAGLPAREASALRADRDPDRDGRSRGNRPRRKHLARPHRSSATCSRWPAP